MANFSNDCERVYSSDRYLITGVAGPFLDPFYSPGSDFIALGNTFITDIIRRDRDGESVENVIEFYNATLLDFFRGALNIYDHQYRIWGNPQVMTCKLTWDYAYYWGVFALLYFNEKFTDIDFLSNSSTAVGKLQALAANMQRFFRDWDQAVNTKDENFYVDQFDIDFLHDFHKGMVVRHTDPALEHRVLENITICESIAKWMILQAYKQIHDGGMPLDLAEINPSDLTYAELIALPAGCADKSADPSVPGLEKIWVSGDLQQLEENL